MNTSPAADARLHIDTAAVVAGVDGSPTAIRAAQWAAVAAAARHTPLLLVHVARRPALGPRSSEILADARQAVIGRWRQTTHTPAPEITELTLHGDPATALIDLSATASEVVVGSLGHARTAQTMLGSVAMSVSAAARSPVTVVRPLRYAASAVGPILVVLDPVNPGTADTLAAGMRAAQERATNMVVVELTRSGAASSASGGDVEALVTELGARYPTVRTSMITYFGHPRTALERFSSTAQLVVVAREHRTLWPPQQGMGRTALGHTRCAVSVIPEPTAAPTGIERFLAHARIEADRVFARPDHRHRTALEQGAATR